MPSFFCKWPTCNVVVPAKGFCATHGDHAGDDARHYDQLHRDQRSRQFYNSKEWQRTRRHKLDADPICQKCGRAFATLVHHVAEVRQIRDSTPELLTAGENLESLCQTCHNKHHKGRR